MIGVILVTSFYSVLSIGLTPYSILFPILHAVFYVLLILIIFLRDKVSRVASVYICISYVLFALLQSSAVTENYGLVIITSNLILFLFVAFTWGLESLLHHNKLLTPHFTPINIIFLIMSFIAFWLPINYPSLLPDFNPFYLLFSESVLTFCMMTPIFITFLLLFYPKVNIVTLRVTSFIGLLIGIYNLQGVFYDLKLWWMVSLHMPLIIISLYGFVKSFKKLKKLK